MPKFLMKVHYSDYVYLKNRLGTMAGTWFIVLISFCGSLTYMNRPVIPCIYSKLKNLGNILFLAHTLLITLFWQHGTTPHTHSFIFF